jgi:hypothetical protein
MSKADKKEQKIRKNITNVSLEDFEALINQYGFIKDTGSHPKARIGNYTMPYKRENPVKVCYVKELLQIIDSV